MRKILLLFKHSVIVVKSCANPTRIPRPRIYRYLPRDESNLSKDALLTNKQKNARRLIPSRSAHKRQTQTTTISSLTTNSACFWVTHLKRSKLGLQWGVTVDQMLRSSRKLKRHDNLLVGRTFFAGVRFSNLVWNNFTFKNKMLRTLKSTDITNSDEWCST